MSTDHTSVAKVRSRDGTAIAFDRTGDGPPIIFVGGAFEQRSDRGMTQLAAILAPRFAVFNYDRRGRGDSDDTAPYAAEREVEDLEALIAAAGGSAFVFGMSSGGVLALEAARRLPITRLAVYDPPFMVDDSGPQPPADHEAKLTELVSSGRPGDAVERLRSVTVPTLVIDGEESDPRLRRAARALWAVLPDVQKRTLEGQTHEWAPEALAPALEAFFAGSTVRGRVEI